VSPAAPGRDPRRDACDDLARRLLSPEGQATGVSPELTGPVEAPAERTPVETADEIAARYRGDESAPIGIWMPDTRDGRLVFVRDDTALTREWWPPHSRLEPKRSLLPLRIVLLGESTAAGWFYAPGLTPATVLAERLAAARGKGIYEVLDLTMVNLQAPPLTELAGAALQLDPDVMVVFAGNNWPLRLPFFPDVSAADGAEAAQALRAGGMAGLRRLADERTRTSASATVEILARLAEAGGVSLVVVIPEVSLGDWPRDRPVPWLPGDAAARWHAAHARTLGALEAGAGPEAVHAARAMLELDGGVSATSHRLLGDALAAQGRAAEARAAYAAAVDARAWDNFPPLPSATSVVRDAIREGAAAQEIACVDLPAVLAAESPEIPGRRLFLDYCHLTVEGMRVTMAAVAAEVQRVVEPAPQRTSRRADARRTAAIAPDTDATVKFLTALYTAHWGQPPDLEAGPGPALAREWLAAALQASPAIETALRAYAASRAAPLSAAALSSAHRQMAAAITELGHESTGGDGLDPEVVETIRALLAARGRPLGDEVEAELIRHHGVGGGAVDLLHPPYHWRWLDRYEGGSGFGQDAGALYRARWPASHFCLVAEGVEAVRLALTARLPRVAGDRAGELAVAVNGAPVGRAPLTDRWSRATLDLPPGRLRRGFNRVTLRWPALPAEGDAALAQIARRLDQGIPTDLHPVFGELFTLRARPP
jgi:hypothetical protein